METEKMIYLVTEYAAGGEIFGKFSYKSYFFTKIEINVCCLFEVIYIF